MATENDDLEPRVSALEGEVAELRGQVDQSERDGAAARVLAAGADQDVSEVRSEAAANRRLLAALRQTQLEQGRRIDQGFAQVDQRFAQVDQQFAVMGATVGAGLAVITGMLDRLIDEE